MKAVFDTIAPAVGLRVGLAVGQTSIVAEAAELVRFEKKMVHSFGYDEASKADDVGNSCVDVLVATPGRLMDHLRNTKGFTLQHLYYLVSYVVSSMSATCGQMRGVISCAEMVASFRMLFCLQKVEGHDPVSFSFV